MTKTFSFKTMMMLATLALALTACDKKNEGRSTKGRVTGSVNNVVGSGISGNQPTCGSAAANTGRVFDNGGMGGDFTLRVKDLISATVNPDYFGTVDGSAYNNRSGVTIQGRLRADVSGNVKIDETNLQLVIYDSYVGTPDAGGNIINPYAIDFAAADSGTVNNTDKTFQVKFKDTYGEIILQGHFDAVQVTGTIQFTNYTHAVSGQPPRSGILGSFQMGHCALFH